MTDKPVIVWFRNDLRIKDNPALFAAQETGAPVIPVYVFDEKQPQAPGAASLWWLHHSLAALGLDLKRIGAQLILRRGDSIETIVRLVEETDAAAVLWNRRYYPEHIKTDKKLKTKLTAKSVAVKSFNGALLREPWDIKTKSGGQYRIYTPFWRSLRALGPARATSPRIKNIIGLKKSPMSDNLNMWGLLPTSPDWAQEIHKNWTPGEKGAQDRLRYFLSGPVHEYADGRDRPDYEFTSRLSPHLAFGEISPVQIWRDTTTAMEKHDIDEAHAIKFLSELTWREFSHNLLFHYPSLPENPLRREYLNFPWRNNKKEFDAWKKGQTGYPIVDAGMRQLWRTGWMHNRVRMIVASFLIKDLLIDWRWGKAWFWDTLVDADLANNTASWQWVAGCGADAAPYFRIFNPVTQGRKFDPNGDYVRAFAPELAGLPAKFIHAPWTAPDQILEKAGVILGKTYKNPIIDHAFARRRALERYDTIKKS